MADDRPSAMRELVHIVDDEEEVRRSVAALLAVSGYWTRTWSDGRSFLRAAKSLAPACILVDLNLPGLSGLELQEELQKREIEFPLVFMTGAGDVSSAVRAMRSGALHFLEKPFAPEELRNAVGEAIVRVRNGGNSDDGGRAIEKMARLSNRENQVLRGLTAGLPNKAIAFDLGVSPRTIEVHRASIMRKLDAGSFAETLRIAFEAGL